MHLLLVSHLLGRYMILVIFPTPVEPLLVPLPEVVVYFLMKPCHDALLVFDLLPSHCQYPVEWLTLCANMSDTTLLNNLG
jgi:hypothetical protein